ncbi:MAG: oxygen-independent coproporphyrinogen III oxidase [Pelagibacteraceae bacterium]|nr:oxygen-independent coproporphyrinogen III oxidase [Pelagibacteraceae bacterium]
MKVSKKLLFSNNEKEILQLVPDYSVPRYTSYPTAPNFHDKINNDTYESWLKKLDKNKKISLYIHIPFCSSLCYFCGCHTSVVNKYKAIENYVSLLLREIEILGEKLESKFNVSHIHFGGGTPSILKGAELWLIMQSIKKRFNILKDCKIAMEIDPRFFKQNLTIILNDCGFDRISIGVQDFSQNVQTLINRKQSFEITNETVKHLRENNISNINIDLIYGLPKQTVQTFADTLEKISILRPERISAFGYAYVPWMKKQQRLIKDKPLNNEDRLKFYRLASNYFLSNGYKAFGIDHYAEKSSSIIQNLKNRKLQRNFQGYTEDDAEVLIGIGASSISSLPDGYVQNIAKIADYIKTLKKNKLPISRGYRLKTEDKMYSIVIKELMCYLNVDLKQVSKKFSKDINLFSTNIKKLKPFIDTGYLDFQNFTLSIKPEARPLVRIICSVFDQYFEPKTNRYSFGI